MNPERRNRGFTLIEVLVAMMILSISLGVIMNLLSASTRHSRYAWHHRYALSLAESRMAELMAAAQVQEGQAGGELRPPFRWQSQVERWRFPQQDLQSAARLTPYRISVTVSWGESDTEQIELHSVQLVDETRR